MTRTSRRVASRSSVCSSVVVVAASQGPHTISNSEITQIIQKELCECLIVLTLWITRPDDAQEGWRRRLRRRLRRRRWRSSRRWWERIFRMIYVFVWFRRLRSPGTNKLSVLTGSGYGPDGACFRIPVGRLRPGTDVLSVRRIYLFASRFFSFNTLTGRPVRFMPI